LHHLLAEADLAHADAGGPRNEIGCGLAGGRRRRIDGEDARDVSGLLRYAGGEVAKTARLDEGEQPRVLAHEDLVRIRYPEAGIEVAGLERCVLLEIHPALVAAGAHEGDGIEPEQGKPALAVEERVQRTPPRGGKAVAPDLRQVQAEVLGDL